MADTEQEPLDPIEQLVEDSRAVLANEVLTLLDTLEAEHTRAQLMDSKFTALRMVHQKEMFGDCTEDGDPYPCKTIQILDWMLGDTQPEEKN